MATPSKISDEIQLEISDVKLIDNISKTPQDSFLPSINFNKQIQYALYGEHGGINYIPILFHSHPRPEMEDYQTSNSEQDIKVATTISHKFRDVTFYFPEALILVKKDGTLFIGFYGGGVAPLDLMIGKAEVIIKSTFKMASEVIGWGFEEGSPWWQKLLGILGGIVSGGSGLYLATGLKSTNSTTVALSNEFANMLQQDQNDYFGLARSDTALNVSIPKKNASTLPNKQPENYTKFSIIKIE